MKIRAGFVSNSSSSMFVVAFPHIPKSAKDVQKMMFSDSPFHDNPYDNGKTKTEDIAKTVWEDIKPQKRWKEKIRINKIGEALRGCDGQPDSDQFKVIPNCVTELEYDGRIIITAKPKERIDWDKYNKACDEHTQKVMGKLLKDWDGRVIYIFNYGDENEYFSILEHGGIFDNLPHKQINNH